MSLKDVKFITHKNCHDGSTCAALFIVCGGKKENVIFSNPNYEEVDEIAKDLYYNCNQQIIFADISVSTKTAELLNNRTDVLLFDHHKTAIPLSKFNWCEIDIKNERCGSKIFFDWCVNKLAKNDEHLYYKLNEYTHLVEIIDDLDRWKHQHKITKCFSRLHYVLGQELFVERVVLNPSVELNDRELYITHVELQKEEQYIEEKKRSLIIKEIKLKDKKYKVAFIEAWKYQNELSEAIKNDLNIDVDAVIMVGSSSISMRKHNSSSDIDLSVIASLNNGGGHAAAAGMLLRNVLGFDLVEKTIENMKWE